VAVEDTLLLADVVTDDVALVVMVDVCVVILQS